MALLVWLPLRGDLKNLGLSDIEIINNNVNFNSSGKIGSCIKTTNSNQFKIITRPWMELNLSNSLSISMWIKYSGSSSYVIACTSYEIYFNSTRLGWRLGDGSGHSIDAYVSGTYSEDTWYHLTCTWDPNIKTISTYINGVLARSVKDTSTAAYKTISSTINFTYSNTYYINDLRIYDHCLSPKEVKEVSKGLVLHYKLNDINLESTVNLCTYSTTYDSVTEGQEYTVSKWGGDNGTITYYRSGGYNDGPYKVYHKTASGTGGIFKKLGEDIHIISGKTYTMSVYVKASRNFTDSTHSFNINRNAATQYSSGNRYLTYNKNVSFTTEWQRISRTFTATDADAGDYGEMSIVYNDEVEDYYVYYSCFQIEESDRATEYVNGSRNPKIIDNLFSYSNLEGHGSSWVLQSETFYGHPIYKNVVTSPDTGNNAGFRIHSSITHSLLSLVTKITISFYKRLNVVYGKNLGGYVQVTKSDDTTTNYSWSYNKSNWANDSNSIGVWDYITATVTIPTGCKLINLLYVYTDRATGGDCDFTAILLELSSVATPINNLLSKYVIETGNICLDYSGYNNNGTITGYLNVTSDVSRYNYSTIFNGINSCITVPYKAVNPSGIFTVNLWFKKDTWGAKGFETLFGGPSGFEMDTRSSTSTTLMIYMASTRGGKRNLVTTMSLGNWYMVTMTRNDEKERYYVNGIFQSEIESKSMPNGNYFIGAWYNITRLNYLGLISDFRLYSTVLSEEDIKELYNTSAIVDNLGNTYGYLFEETSSNNITKTGIVNSNLFVEKIDYLYLLAGNSINTELYYDTGDVCLAITTIRYDSGGSGRDLMGFSGAGAGYWGVTAAGAWEPHGTFSYTNSDITQINTISYLFVSTSRDIGYYRVGSLVNATSYSVRNKYIYSVKLYKNNILERDLIPFKEGTQYGLYDLVNKHFYACNTGGTLSIDKAKETKMFNDHLEANQLIEI